MGKLMQGIGIMVVIVVLGVAGWSFLGSNATPDKEITSLDAASVAAPLGKDEDTADAQIRYLSWGKFNYNPEQITVKAGKKVRIVGDTTRLSGCFQSFRIPELNVEGQFTDSNAVVEFTPAKTGTFGFGCAMGMGRGSLIVQ